METLNKVRLHYFSKAFTESKFFGKKGQQPSTPHSKVLSHATYKFSVRKMWLFARCNYGEASVLIYCYLWLSNEAEDEWTFKQPQVEQFSALLSTCHGDNVDNHTNRNWHFDSSTWVIQNFIRKLVWFPYLSSSIQMKDCCRNNECIAQNFTSTICTFIAKTLTSNRNKPWAIHSVHFHQVRTKLPSWFLKNVWAMVSINRWTSDCTVSACWSNLNASILTIHCILGSMGMHESAKQFREVQEFKDGVQMVKKLGG